MQSTKAGHTGIAIEEVTGLRERNFLQNDPGQPTVLGLPSPCS